MDAKRTYFSAQGNCPVILYLTGPHNTSESSALWDQLKSEISRPFDFCELSVADWDRFLTPWPAENCMKGRSFLGQAPLLLSQLETEFLPELGRCIPGSTKIYIAGYSLAGLFALWSLYQTSVFAGAVCCSGSLWYPEWTRYIEATDLPTSADVYLSLGRKEPQTKHPLIKQVGEATELQYRLLQANKKVRRTTLEWQDGGHFNNVTDRVIKGISWILSE